MIKYTYENSETEINKIQGESIFLAGPTVRHNQKHLTSWRNEAIRILESLDYQGSVILPEFLEPKENADFDVPMWEYAALKKANVVALWLPRTEELIGLTTNFEFGFWLAKNQFKLKYGRPDDAYRISYCDKMWTKVSHENGIDVVIHNTLENLLKDCIASDSFEQRVKNIKNQILLLESEKAIIESKLMKQATTFAEIWKIWRDSDSGEDYGWLVDEKSYPKIRKYCDKHFDMQRHQHIDLLERMEEDFYYAFEALEEDMDDWEKENWNLDFIKEIREVAEEMVAKNIKSFTCDW